MGVGCLHSKNLGLLGKWKWCFLTEENALWRIVIKDFYGVDGGFGSSVNSNASGGISQDIIKAVKLIENIDISFKYSFTRKISSGADTMFWKDSWCGDVWGGRWSWRFAPRGRANDDLSSPVSLIGNLSLLEEVLDKWIWSKDSSDRLATRPNLLKCPKVLSVWKKVLCWWNLESPVSFPSFSITVIALGKIKVNGCSKIAKEKAGILEEDLFPSIQRLSKLWFSARIVSRPANWSVWIAI
ncbi:hypothetical protein Tco_0742673 [Tanacetum coccineum]